MLKSKTKKARENIKSYILQNFNPQNYEGYPDEFCGDKKILMTYQITLLKFLGKSLPDIR